MIINSLDTLCISQFNSTSKLLWSPNKTLKTLGFETKNPLKNYLYIQLLLEVHSTKLHHNFHYYGLKISKISLADQTLIKEFRTYNKKSNSRSVQVTKIAKSLDWSDFVSKLHKLFQNHHKNSHKNSEGIQYGNYEQNE